MGFRWPQRSVSFWNERWVGNAGQTRRRYDIIPSDSTLLRDDFILKKRVWRLLGKRFACLLLFGFLGLSDGAFAQETDFLPQFIANERLHFYLVRPIHWDKTDWVDRYYPYGWNAHNGLATHHGVEFQNRRFTPVLAAASGVVVFAGRDSEQVIGPHANYYGRVVIIRHHFTAEGGQPVYSLYGHLQDVLVEEGQVVREWHKIGRVGDSGVALGAHLHFEVRVGPDPYDYYATRNPELWLRVYPGYGTLAGRMVFANGELARGWTIQLQRDLDHYYPQFVYTYVDDQVNPDPELQENFVVGDVPAGEYVVLVSNGNGRVLYRKTVEIRSERVSWLDIQLPSAPPPPPETDS